MFDLFALVAAFILFLIGAACVVRARTHVRPEFRGDSPLALFWNYHEYAARGQRLLRVSWSLSAIAIVLLVLAAVT
jgi:hypothetical protein